MMLAEANFTPIVVRVPMDHMQALWLRFGTVRYDFQVSWFFSSLCARFVPVRFSRRRYGTVHPSIGGCTRTTPVPPDPYRLARARLRATAEDTATAGFGGAGYTIDAGPVTAGARQ
jgi:hypothetical protein